MARDKFRKKFLVLDISVDEAKARIFGNAREIGERS